MTAEQQDRKSELIEKLKQQALSMLPPEPPQWTSELPTATGIYWIRMRGKDKPRICELFHIRTRGPELYVGFIDDDHQEPVPTFAGSAWIGPIEPPAPRGDGK